MEFPRQGYRSELPFPSPGDLPNPETELTSPALEGIFFTPEPPGKPTMENYSAIKKNEILSFVATWMDLELIILSEGSQTEEEKYQISYDITNMQDQKNDRNEYIYETETDSQIKNL